MTKLNSQPIQETGVTPSMSASLLVLGMMGALILLSVSFFGSEVGVLKEEALADLIPVDGDLLQNKDLVAVPDKNFVVIMKDGIIYKNVCNQ